MRPLASSFLLVLLAACGSPPSEAIPDASPPDATQPDAAPPDAALPPTLGPSLVFDDIHIASLLEEAHAFSLLGGALNPQLQQLIDDGTLLLGIELRSFEDPASPTDEDMTVGMYTLVDTDEDLTDNFDPDAPELFALGPGAFVMDEPAIHFTTAAVTGGSVHGEGVDSLDVLDSVFPIPISNLVIDGDLAVDGAVVRSLESGRLRGAIGASLLSLTPNLVGEMCSGESLLDVLATGCGLFPLQPDSDVDGDGLEQFYDTDGDGAVDQCVDGDGTEINGTDCPRDPAIADGYELVFVIHGVRAHILE